MPYMPLCFVCLMLSLYSIYAIHFLLFPGEHILDDLTGNRNHYVRICEGKMEGGRQL